MSASLSILLAQLNPVVGDIARNAQKVLSVRDKNPQADLIVFTELVISGYPPEDLVLKPAFLKRCRMTIESLALKTKTGPALLVSAPWEEDGKRYNSALLLAEGKICAIRHKHELPNYGVFDEKRVFAQGPLPAPVDFKNFRLGVLTCEDMWFPAVSKSLKDKGAQILIALNGSPFEIDKPDIREQHARARVQETGLSLIYLNQIGGQDELVFDGASFVLDEHGKTLTTFPAFEEHAALTVWEKNPTILHCTKAPEAAKTYGALESVYKALILGLRDYVDKNGFTGIVLGMSGGIDSALSAAIAVDALGAGRVTCIMMPSPYTSQMSLDDAKTCTENLGAEYKIIPIDPAMKSFDEMTGGLSGLAAENIQARTRGMLLMAISNSTGCMVLSTGNKSEMSVGYATLYGDMCGGYNVLKDIYKTTVFELARWRNTRGAVIPGRIITRPPSAELKPDQSDQDSLPPYEKLDDILKCLVEGEMGLEEITARGHTAETVNGIWKLLDRAEYKRRQAPPGVKISSRAFGRDRRYPMTNHFTDLLTEEKTREQA